VLAATQLPLIVAVYLYFTGWSYEYFYFGRFHVTFQASGIPFYSVFMYAFSAFLGGPTQALAFVGLTIAVLGLALVRTRLSSNAQIVVTVATIVALFPLLQSLTKRAADEVIEERFRTDGFAHVRLFFRQGVGIPPIVLQENESGHLRLLSETDDGIYVFTANDIKQVTTFLIRKADVAGTQLGRRSG
jgi:hypothetical protein